MEEIQQGATKDANTLEKWQKKTMSLEGELTEANHAWQRCNRKKRRLKTDLQYKGSSSCMQNWDVGLFIFLIPMKVCS
jgi:hypothetical protein